MGSLPKGLVHKKGSSMTKGDPGNPFELTARMKRPKLLVHNRPVSKPKSTKHALESLQRRQNQLKTTLKSSKKANVMVDRRIGEYDSAMSASDQMLARLVKERSRQSQRSLKFRLDDNDDDDNELLTHKGQRLDPNKAVDLYSDDEDDDNGNLEAIDTELHFGGAGMREASDPYGSGSMKDALSEVYGQRKTELDDLIARRKTIKAEKMRTKESQVETVEKLDEDFGEFANLLLFRKDQPRPKVQPEPTEEDKEMNEWHMEMKQMMLKPKGRATDRTKTPEEIAKEEAERLHKLETRRLARMNGDFEEDELSDISLDGAGKPKKKKSRRRQDHTRSPEELSDSEDEDAEKDNLEARFTADGLKYFDKDGNVVEKTVEEEEDSEDEDDDEQNGKDLPQHPLSKGTRVQGNYRIAEQFDGREAWYEGEITKVHILADGSIRYDVEYLDGDFEEDMLPENVRPIEKSQDATSSSGAKDTSLDKELQMKRKKAREKARTEMPYIFEVPTTLEVLHDIIARYATTGKDVTTIIQRIYRGNSVRLDHRNTEKMQNFYDVLLRRFIAVGDAIFESGNGGEELARFDQLNALTKILYAMAQDSPETAGAVWSRRIGILQNAHDKRLRDLELVVEDDEGIQSPWLSTGTFLLLKAASAIFPVTDKRHYVITPINLFLGQILSQTPMLSSFDVVLGILCSGLLLENGLPAKRVVPEALAFLSGSIRLLSSNPDQFPISTFESAYQLPDMQSLRSSLEGGASGFDDVPTLRLENDFVSKNDEEVAIAMLNACISIIDKVTMSLQGSFALAVEPELLDEVSNSLLTLRPKQLPEGLRKTLSDTASHLAAMCPSSRAPLRRQAAAADQTVAIKTLVPRMEDPERYTLSKDVGKKAVQVAIDRTRREYKREHKAISRELRMDASFIESERRADQEKRDSKERAKRHKNFAWLEGEAATLNQQVAQGGGLLKGGGMGVARAKAKSGKLGIKKGGKF